jgi:hypothetical protein
MLSRESGIGLDDVIDIALERSGRASHASSPFGAAGPIAPQEVALFIRSPAPGGYSEDPMNRLFDTIVGRDAASAVGNERRTLAAIERLSVEAIAASLLISGQAEKDDRFLVMPATPSRRTILMLMSPRVGSAKESRVISDELKLPLDLLFHGLREAVDPRESSPETTVLRELLGGGPRALAEAFHISQPEVVLTRRPRMIPLSVLSPLMPIESGGKLSTAGMLCRDADGDVGVTGAYHATGPVGTDVVVGGHTSRVKRASEVQDTVFIPLGSPFGMPSVGLGGVRQDREPGRSDRVRFDGRINQNRGTRIYGTDAGLLRARPTIMLKLQTDPDTDQGDSGCALIDQDDKVLGFAFERTAYDDHPQFTDWIWAANALRALGLAPYNPGV